MTASLRQGKWCSCGVGEAGVRKVLNGGGPQASNLRDLLFQVAIVTDALRGGVVALIRDLNGNHVIQRCLQRLGPEDSQFVYDAACLHTTDIATHRHGCCVLQRCIDFATTHPETVSGGGDCCACAHAQPGECCCQLMSGSCSCVCISVLSLPSDMEACLPESVYI